MVKWADYCIWTKHYDLEHKRIVNVKLFPDKEDGLGTESEWTRTQVVSAIEAGTAFVTILKKPDKNFKRGQDVHIITVDGVKYIRTDQNKTKADNLENLPEY